MNDFPSLCCFVSFILKLGASHLVLLPGKFYGDLLIGPLVAWWLTSLIHLFTSLLFDVL